MLFTLFALGAFGQDGRSAREVEDKLARGVCWSAWGYSSLVDCFMNSGFEGASCGMTHCSRSVQDLLARDLREDEMMHFMNQQGWRSADQGARDLREDEMM